MSAQLKIVLLFVACAACSYQVRKGESQLGGAQGTGTQNIFIPVVDNLSVRTGFEGGLTSAVRKALSQVKGVALVNDSGSASHYLLGTVLSYDVVTRSSRQGSPTTQSLGGLVADQSSAQDMTLTLKVRFQLIEKQANSAFKHELWTRDFTADGVFEASHRLNKAGADISAGSESAPQINDSRELIQARILSDSIASKVLDQVVQDF